MDKKRPEEPPIEDTSTSPAYTSYAIEYEGPSTSKAYRLPKPGASVPSRSITICQTEHQRTPKLEETSTSKPFQLYRPLVIYSPKESEVDKPIIAKSKPAAIRTDITTVPVNKEPFHSNLKCTVSSTAKSEVQAASTVNTLTESEKQESIHIYSIKYSDTKIKAPPITAKAYLTEISALGKQESSLSTPASVHTKIKKGFAAKSEILPPSRESSLNVNSKPEQFDPLCTPEYLLSKCKKLPPSKQSSLHEPVCLQHRATSTRKPLSSKPAETLTAKESSLIGALVFQQNHTKPAAEHTEFEPEKVKEPSFFKETSAKAPSDFASGDTNTKTSHEKKLKAKRARTPLSEAPHELSKPDHPIATASCGDINKAAKPRSILKSFIAKPGPKSGKIDPSLELATFQTSDSQKLQKSSLKKSKDSDEEYEYEANEDHPKLVRCVEGTPHVYFFGKRRVKRKHVPRYLNKYTQVDPTRLGFELEDESYLYDDNDDVEQNNIYEGEPGDEAAEAYYAASRAAMDAKMEEERQYVSFTGFMSDGERRVDLVLVVAETMNETSENMKTRFIISVLKAGFELEFDHGEMPHHRNLVFIKVHAPDKVLVEFGNAFYMKKLFKDKHLEFMKPKDNGFDNIFAFEHEREWVKLVRKNYHKPLLYSNLERSTITFLVLLHQPFGPAVNHISLNRLIYHNIILDAYPLHDGPYFFLTKQDYRKLNARQILFYNWLGMPNLLTNQPMNLIYEYFGSKVAFYFAYYEFYNRGLMVASIVSLFTILLQVSVGRHQYKVVWEDVCKCKYTYVCIRNLCPLCNNFKICRFGKVRQSCYKLKIINYLDNIFTVTHCICLSLGASIFIIMWRRYEDYWIWLWELCFPPRRGTIRAEYTVRNTDIRRSKKTGVIERWDDFTTSCPYKTIVKSVMGLCLLLIITIYFVSVDKKSEVMNRYRHRLINMKPVEYQRYYILMMYGAIMIPLLFIVEELCKLIAHHITRLENHITYENFERSVIQKVFTISAICTFLPLVYTGWLKGVFYTFPHLHWNPTVVLRMWNVNISIAMPALGKFIHVNCGPFGCFDELAVMMMLTLLFRVVIVQVLPTLWPMKTDYNIKKEFLLTAHAWEREYQLISINERIMTEHFNTLILQFAMMTLFAAAFPLAPIIALLVGIFHIRFKAKQFLLGSRRPLLFRIPDLGTWNSVLTFICFSIGFSNAVTIVRNTNTIFRYIYLKEGFRYDLKEFAYWKMTWFNTTHYWQTNLNQTLIKMNRTMPSYCYFQGLYRQKLRNESIYRMKWPYHWNNVTYDPGSYLPHRAMWQKNLFDVLFITGFEGLIVGSLLLMKYYVPSVSKPLKMIKQVELTLKRVHAMETLEMKNLYELYKKDVEEEVIEVTVDKEQSKLVKQEMVKELEKD